ncbi:ABC transporter permease [Lachnospiraceae bacterium]|nr:ABC transporter permease [Lachnospiraceae bacterium]
MKHTIDKLALSNVRQNSFKSILLIISIFLSTLLLTAVAGFGYGMVKHNHLNAGNLYGNYCATFNRVTEQQYETIKLRSEFTHVGKTAYAAQVDPGKNQIDMGLAFMDSNAAENINFANSLKVGTLPQKENEIAATEEFFAYLGQKDVKPKDHVTVLFRRDNRSQFEEKEFVVSGVVKSQNMGTVQKALQGYISQEFYESLYPQEMRLYGVTFRVNESVEMNGNNCEEIIQELGERCGITKNNVSLNSMYLMWIYEPATETVMACIMIAFIVILVSVVVIYNIFRVGMVQKIQEYGKIKALGATKRQMKKMILREGMLLSAVGIPLGLLAGCGVASVLFQQIFMKISERVVDAEITSVSILSLPLLLLAALAALLTVRLALSRPMKTVAKISPVEAIRYQESSSRKKSVRKGRKKISVLGMTLSGLSANRGRTISTIITMGLSCVLFVALSHFVGNIDNEFETRRNMEYGQFSIELDYSLDDKVYPENNLSQIQKENPLGTDLQEKLREIPGVTEVRSRKLFAVENRSRNGMDEEGSRTSICVMDREEFERYGKGSALGTVDYDEVSAEDGIIFGYSHFMEDYGYELGEEMFMKDLTEGQAVYQGKLMGAFGSAPASWVITEETFQKLGITGDVTEKLWIDCRKQEKEKVEEAIQQLLSGVAHVETDSYDNAMKVVRAGTNIMQWGIYVFLGFLGIIGFMNMANTMITGVVTRKRELGVLQAVGMTNRQLNLMLQLEGILFSVGTVIVSLAVGSPIGYALFRYAKEIHVYGLNEYHFPWLQIGVMILIILLLQGMLSFLLSRNLRKESLIERINYQG